MNWKENIWKYKNLLLSVILIVLIGLFVLSMLGNENKSLKDKEASDTNAMEADAEISTTGSTEETSGEEQTSGMPETTEQSEETQESATVEETTIPETTTVSETTTMQETTTMRPVHITPCDETVWATIDVNIRQSYTAASDVVGVLMNGKQIQRTGICDNGWSKVLYHGTEAYINSKYLTTTEPVKVIVEETTTGIVAPENFMVDINQDKYTANTFKINHPEFKISDALSDELYTFLNAHTSNIRVYALSLDGKISFGYNPDKSYFAACTVKAGYALNLYHQVEAGRLDLNTVMTYEEGMYHGGSGIIREEPYGTTYTVQQLIDYSLIHSDNIAYDMVRDIYGRAFVSDYDRMVSELGCSSTRLGSRNWANTTARDMVRIMREIYRYSQTSPYGEYLLNTLFNTQWNSYQELLPQYKSAAKIGYTEDVCCMTGIIFGDVPYLLCVSVADESTQFNPMVILCNKIMEEYCTYVNNN